MSKIQHVQNSAARLVTKARRADHITKILRKLHWLPVRKRFIFKMLLFTYKILNGLVPCYVVYCWLFLRHIPRIIVSWKVLDTLRAYLIATIVWNWKVVKPHAEQLHAYNWSFCFSSFLSKKTKSSFNQSYNCKKSSEWEDVLKTLARRFPVIRWKSW